MQGPDGDGVAREMLAEDAPAEHDIRVAARAMGDMDHGLLQPKQLPRDKTYVFKEFLGPGGDVADPYPDGRDPETLAKYAATAQEIRAALVAGRDRLTKALLL